MNYALWIAIFIVLSSIVSCSAIWALNTVFPALAIPYNLETIPAMLILILLVDPARPKGSK